MRHLTPADYRVQPWANGLGQTVEMLRLERDGAVQLRLSMARVDRDGPFSLFPGIERNLTVIAGPGFRLEGPGIALDCRPLEPVAFAGDVAVRAEGTGGAASDDFNVMSTRHLPRPEVEVIREQALPGGGLLALFALEPGQADGRALGRHDLLLTEGPVALRGLFIAVRARGIDFGEALAAAD